jgi:nucleoside-diphosphate-sugar epimerase
MKPKSLLIIGGTGFFGQSILKHLSINNCAYININKIFILSRGKLKLAIYNQKLKKKFKIIKINFNILTVKNLPTVDYVIYAAILKNYKNDNKAVNKYLDLAKKYHLKSKILYISSGAIYGKQSSSIVGFKENYLKFNNKIPFKRGYKKEYSNIKMKNEKSFQKFAKKIGAKVSIARCFSFVGEFLPRNSQYILGNFIKNILNNQNLNIKADYQIIRSYMHEEDLVIWLLKILNSSNKNCPIYNVGSDNAISIYKLATLLAKKYNLNIDFDNIKISKKNFDKYVPNIKKAKKKLNLINNYSSIDAINKTINLLIKNNEKIN